MPDEKKEIVLTGVPTRKTMLAIWQQLYGDYLATKFDEEIMLEYRKVTKG